MRKNFVLFAMLLGLFGLIAGDTLSKPDSAQKVRHHQPILSRQQKDAHHDRHRHRRVGSTGLTGTTGHRGKQGKKVNAANMVVRDQQGLLAIEVAKVTREIEAEGAGVVIQAQQVRQDRRDKLAQLVQ